MRIKDFTATGPLTRVSDVLRTGEKSQATEARGFGGSLTDSTGLDGAIRRSQDFLLREQKPEGYWMGELMVDSTLASDLIAYHHWNGKVDAAWQRKAVNHILSMQLPD